MTIPIKRIILEGPAGLINSVAGYARAFNNSKQNINDSQMNHASQKFNPVDAQTKLNILTNGKADPALYNDMLLSKSKRLAQTGRVHNIGDNIKARIELMNNPTTQLKI